MGFFGISDQKPDTIQLLEFKEIIHRKNASLIF
jgi:hypothetical protein